MWFAGARNYAKSRSTERGFLCRASRFWEGFDCFQAPDRELFLGVCSPSASETTGYQAYDACSGDDESNDRKKAA